MGAPLKDTLRNFMAQIRYRWAKLEKEIFTLNRRNWKWIAAASLLVLLLFVTGNLVFYHGSLNLWWMLVAGGLFAVIPLLYGALIRIGLVIARQVPVHVSWLVFAAAAMFFIYFSLPLKGVLILLFYILLTFVFIAGALSNILDRGWKQFPRRKRLVNIFFLCVGVSNLFVTVFFLAYPGRAEALHADTGAGVLHPAAHLALPDPSLPGAYDYSFLTYGAGSDRHRKEFNETATMLSATVDGHVFLEGWDRVAGMLRSFFWGFGAGELPLNGRVWLPAGEGPFPVIMIVHGNHFDRDFSDAGYAYLGEHLASHGYLAVSVDENFLNHGLADFNHALEEENDARGWLLLKHLELMRNWSEDTASVLFGKADTDRVILVGHSRGGEAASIAACFNQLPYFPDDASETFEFNFGIRGIVAIAPVDGQYFPGNRPVQLSDLNYLSIQGGMDADLDSYLGLQQYNRVSFEDSAYHFKAGMYILHANHGQFNSSWGVNDVGYPQGLLLNRRGLLNARDQQLAALVCITSFVKATLGEETGYVSFFRDHRSGSAWLPGTRYISQFADNRVCKIADFEEDVNLLTTSMGNRAIIDFDGLAALYELENELNKGTLGTKTVMIGWNNTGADAPGRYTITFDPPLDLTAQPFSAFQCDVAVIDRYPGERIRPGGCEEDDLQANVAQKVQEFKDSVMAVDALIQGESGGDRALPQTPGHMEVYSEQSSGEEADPEIPWYAMEENEPGDVGFAIVLTDVSGNKASVDVSDYYPLFFPAQLPLYKLRAFYKEAEAEPVPQHVEINLHCFFDACQGFDREKLSSLEFVFDRAPDGMVSIDNIGFTVSHPFHRQENVACDKSNAECK